MDETICAKNELTIITSMVVSWTETKYQEKWMPGWGDEPEVAAAAAGSGAEAGGTVGSRGSYVPPHLRRSGGSRDGASDGQVDSGSRGGRGPPASRGYDGPPPPRFNRSNRSEKGKRRGQRSVAG